MLCAWKARSLLRVPGHVYETLLELVRAPKNPELSERDRELKKRHEETLALGLGELHRQGSLVVLYRIGSRQA